MEIERVVREALTLGHLGAVAKGQLARLVETVRELSEADYRALLDLRAAIEAGSLRVEGRREFRNVMEEMVAAEIETLSAAERAAVADPRDLLAYALNRLPPLYATTDVGAQYQRERARRELHTLIAEQVSLALHRARAGQEPARPRRPLDGSVEEPWLRHVASLLNRFAADYELPA